MKSKAILLYFLLFACVSVYGQRNPMSKRISANYKNTPLTDVLMDIADRNDIQIAYNAQLFDGNRTITAKYRKKPISRILKQLLPDDIEPRVVGSHIILAKKRPKKQEPAIVEKIEPTKANDFVKPDFKPKAYIIEGYIRNKATGEKIHQATVYDIDGRVTTITNQDGYFRMIFPPELPARGISFSKKGFDDTVIIVQPLTTKLDIGLAPKIETLKLLEKKKANVEYKGLNDQKLVQWMVPSENRINAANLTIYNNKPFQISLLPFLGSNLGMSGSYINKYSFNIFVGYTGGVEIFELGGFANFVKNNANGLQIAGFLNNVGGNSNGIQIGGFHNNTFGKFTGLQVGGFSNIVLDTLRGAQIGGFANVLRGSMEGVQIGGFVNIATQNVDGIQIGGFANIGRKDVDLLQLGGFINYAQNVNGVQIGGFGNVAYQDVNLIQTAGFFNIARDVKFLQIAGFFNTSRDVKAVQLAGFVNASRNVSAIQSSGFINIAKGKVTGLQSSGFIGIAHEVEGVQTAGFICATKKLNGLQVSVFNIVDSLENGMPIGLFNIVRKNGYHALTLHSTDGFTLGGAYRIGTRYLYTILGAGYNFKNTANYNWGLGTIMGRKGSWFQWGLEINDKIVFQENNGKWEYTGEIYSIYSGPHINLNKHIALYGGASFNTSMQHAYFKDGLGTPSFSNSKILSKNLGDQTISLWFDFKAGIAIRLGRFN
jgi:hypothetical protein